MGKVYEISTISWTKEVIAGNTAMIYGQPYVLLTVKHHHSLLVPVKIIESEVR